jgi:hypothetical protein
MKEVMAVVIHHGGCIELNQVPSADISMAVFADCKAERGNAGAIYLFSSYNVDVQTSSFFRNMAQHGGGGAILWDFDEFAMESVTSITDLPIAIASIVNVNNTASYGRFIASGAHSLFMVSGPTLAKESPSLPRENANTYEERIYQESNAEEWILVSGGQTPCKYCKNPNM